MDPAATDGLVRFRIVITIGPLRPTVSRLRMLAGIFAEVARALRPWRHEDGPGITLHVEHDVLDQ